MCFPCQRTSASFCFACGTDHHQAISQTPVQAPATAVVASKASLPAMGKTLACYILEFTPGSAPAFGVACRGLHFTAGDFAQYITGKIFKQCSNKDSLLGRAIFALEKQYKIDCEHEGRHKIYIRLLQHLYSPSNGAGLEPGLSETEVNGARKEQHKKYFRLVQHLNNPSNGTGLEPGLSETEVNEICSSLLSESEVNEIRSSLSMGVHRSIACFVRAQHVTCPNTLLAPQEVTRFSEEIQRKMQDANLKTVWSKRMCLLFLAAVVPPPEDLPASNAQAQDIRAWMRAEDNQALLQGITQLHLTGLKLTCLPEEIERCTALQYLSLANNQLVSLPEGIFRTMTALQELYLNDNQLVFLPKGVFKGMTALRMLFLTNNRLDSLPEGVFQELTALQGLFLSLNQLGTLPEGVFQGLTALQELHLCNNKLTSLPKGVFRDQTALLRLNFVGNPLAEKLGFETEEEYMLWLRSSPSSHPPQSI